MMTRQTSAQQAATCPKADGAVVPSPGLRWSIPPSQHCCRAESKTRMSETPVSDRDSMWSQRRPGSGGIYHRRAVVPKSRAHSQSVVFDRIWNAAQRGGREEQENAEKQHGRRSQGLRFGKRNLLWLLNAGSGDRCCCHAVREVGGN